MEAVELKFPKDWIKKFDPSENDEWETYPIGMEMNEMFTVELKVNGALVGHLYGINTGPVDDGKLPDLRGYEYHYYDTASGTVTHGKVTHRRSNGLQMLVADCILDAKSRMEHEDIEAGS